MPNQNSNKKRASRACWAILDRLPLDSLEPEDVWNYIKKYHGVESRLELTEKQLVVFEARLRAAQENSDLLQAIISKVAEHTIPKLQAYDVVVKDKETQYILVKDVRTQNMKAWAQDRANETGNSVKLVNNDKVVVFVADPIVSDLFVNPDVDGEITRVEFFESHFMLRFHGSDKWYRYDKLNEVQLALCRLFMEHCQFDEMYDYLTKIRLTYQAQMADMI